MAAPADAAPSAGKLEISIVPPSAPATAFARRCTVGGAPLTAPCTGGSHGVALDRAGTLYVANEGAVHRFEIDHTDGCALAPAGEPIALPPDNPRPQVLGKGPVYMRSGGVAWALVPAPDAVYAHDFLVGLYRVDRGKPEPACTTEFGFRTFAWAGKRLLGLRKGVEQVTPGARGACKAKSAAIDDKARALFAAAGRVYTQLDDLGVRICAATAMTACGDGACIVDHNCPKLVQIAADGAVLRTLPAERLFEARPWSVDGAATGRDGTVYLYARHRDKVGDTHVCEAAVYAIPPAVFAR